MTDCVKNVSTNDLNELFLRKMASPEPIIENIYIFMIIPLSFICILLDMFTLILLQSQIVQNTTLKKYYNVYTLSSLFICVLLFFRSLIALPRYTQFSYSYTARIFQCHIFPYSHIVLIFFSNLVNIAILIERLSMFVIKYKRFHIENPYDMAKFFLLLSLIINLVVYFQAKTKNEEEFVIYKSHFY